MNRREAIIAGIAGITATVAVGHSAEASMQASEGLIVAAPQGSTRLGPCQRSCGVVPEGCLV
jgi:hypothetical protein